ncbi:hypothetical protein OUZ56_021743 [Daphnia magna]|uniref:Uncharacterized protein n=1 Tax=Daphnia magna TaxID=35525 RepID=A0ABR0AUU5_9CRUS|nr:hypothetical protein OUZ56_021743 [Daphnia magna]
MPHSGMQFSDEDLGCHVSYTTCLDVVVGPTLFNTDLSFFRTIQITSDTKSAPIGSSRGSSPTPKKPIGGLLRQLGESDSMFLITWNL